MFFPNRSFRCFFVLLILLVLFVEGAIHVTPVSANTISVTTTVDEDVDNSACSLREAIVAADTDTPYHGCSAGSGADIITVPAGIYTLVDYLGIHDAVTISGLTASSTIIEASTCNPVEEACTHERRILYIGEGSTVTLNNLTLRHGRIDISLQAGGIQNVGNLTINNCNITANYGNYGGAIVNGVGTLTINDSKIFDNISFWRGGGINNYGILTINNTSIYENITYHYGGGIYNLGETTINNSNFSFNHADWEGGGIWNKGILTINNNSVYQNTVYEYGGGIYNALALTISNSAFFLNSVYYFDGGGVYNNELVITASRDVEIGWSIITNSTFSANSAGNFGGGIYNDGIAEITNCTFSENEGTEGAGIYNNYSLDFVNTIIANSITGLDCYNSAFGTVGTNLNNLVEAGICGCMIVGDPLLAPLADNGGYTPTHALLFGSLAIDAGSLAECPPTDQRGIPRPKGSECDIGAFEFFVPVFLPLMKK